MSFQYLHDFSGLKIPNVRFVIFTPSDNPFSTRNTETCRDTIFAVGVPDVSFETSGGLVIPETDGVVVSSG